MNMAAKFLLHVGIVLLGVHSAFAIECSTLADGNYDIGCKSYTECKSGVLHQHDCDPHYVYNANVGHCDFETKVDPPCGLIRDCSNVPDKAYADLTRNCTSYYTCVHHIYYGHNYCTPGTVFEETMQTCVWPRDAFAPCGSKTVG